MAKNIKTFDDSLQKDRRKPTSNASSVMSEYAPYRQGVELTQGKDYATGIAKIHSGYNEQDGNHEGPAYVENAGVLGQSRDLSSMASYEEDVVSMDGAIEPFEIRRVATRRIHKTEVTHGQLAFLEEGNVSSTGGVDTFVAVVKFADASIGLMAFEDESTTMGNLRIASEEKSTDHRTVGAFNDENEPKGVMLSELMESDIASALRAMSPSTENFVPPGRLHVGVNGFDDFATKVGPATRYT